MRLYHDRDAELSLLTDRTVAVIGYGNQGSAQALNLRDSGVSVIIGNREDRYADLARADGFSTWPIADATRAADLVLLLIPDEVMPSVFSTQIAAELGAGDALVFASGYSVAFNLLRPPDDVDVILVAPRMIGSGVRDLYLADRGFPSFVGVAQDHTGEAFRLALAIAKGIGSTRAGVVEVTFEQEAELDLFTEQCFGPAFGGVLTTAVELLLEEGYPPAAVLLELYMSGEFAYTLAKIAQLGLIEQSQLHSQTSQYGSMSRGMRFQLPGLRDRMCAGLEEIRSGAFAEEWAVEQQEGYPTLKMLQETARSLPIAELERELLEALEDAPQVHAVQQLPGTAQKEPQTRPEGRGVIERAWASLRDLIDLGQGERHPSTTLEPLSQASMESVLRTFIDLASEDAALREFAKGRQLTTHYVLGDLGLEFHLGFHQGTVVGSLGEPPTPAEVRLEMEADVLDAMLTQRINPARAAMSGKISFDGDTRRAMTVQRVQGDLTRLYQIARSQRIDEQA